MKSDNIEYAEHLGRKYNCHVALENLTGNETTIGQVALAVLPPDLLEKWLEDEKAETRKLREKFDLKPYDKDDYLTIDDLKKEYGK